MRLIWMFLFFSLMCSSAVAEAPGSDHSHRQALRARLHPTSLRELLLFSSLFPDTVEGKSALQQAWQILSPQPSETPPPLPPDFGLTALTLVWLIQPGILPQNTAPKLSSDTIALIDTIGAHLPHRALKGHNAQTLHDIEGLSSHEIDLSRALILLDHQNPDKLTPVEAALDVLALQILAQIGKDADDEAKISAITHLLFDDLAIRFPPQSETSDKAQQFSDLSSVLFSRRGVCLGSSVLYLCLAQRIGLPLSIYTPPGHIFVAHKDKTRLHVIETTARGIDIPVDHYLGLSLKSLPERTMKEVVGMVIFNKTSAYLKEKKWEDALKSYQKALSFEAGDELQLMLSLCELLCGHAKKSQKIAQEALLHIPDYRLEPDLLLVDLAQGTLSSKGGEAIIEFSDAEGEQLLPAIAALQKINSESPHSLTIPFHLAHALLSYGKPKEALPLLEMLCARNNAPCSIHALLSYLYIERMNITGAWNEASKAVWEAQKRGCLPRPLYLLLLQLQQQSPHCADISDLLVSPIIPK